MAIYSGPEIANTGLILNLDPANNKNFNLTAVEVLVVAGGGSGAQAHGTNTVGGGGGGGVVYAKSYAVTPGSSYTVTVGAGGTAPGVNYVAGNAGSNSVFDTITALGGAGGGVTNGVNGGSGSGAGSYNGSASAPFTGGAPTQPTATSIGYGNSGGSCKGDGGGGGGGGGAGGPGESNNILVGGDGGPGFYSEISGTPSYYGGGGGGTGWETSVAGLGGIGGGGNGATRSSGTVTNATPNTGGGGGSSKNGYGEVGGNGGSGIVIIRYPGPQRAIGGTVTRVGNDTVHTFTTVGSTTFVPLATGTIKGLSNLSSNNVFATSVNNPTTLNSLANRSITFNGSTQYMTTPMTNVRPISGITQEVWFNLASTSGNHIFIGSQYGTATGNSYAIWGNGNQWLGGVNTTGSLTSITVTLTKNTSTWYHFVHTYNGSVQKLYVNSQEVASGSVTGNIVYDTNNTLLALATDWNGTGYDAGASGFVNGNVSIIRIYDRGLTPAEVLNLFEISRDRYGV